MWVTDSFLNLAKLLETLTKGLIVGMPRQAATLHGLASFFHTLDESGKFKISPLKLSPG